MIVGLVSTRKETKLMGFKSDIEIAQECTMQPITEIAAKAGIDDKYLEQYGKYKAKIDYNLLKETEKKEIPADSSITFENVSFRYKGASEDEILSHEVQDGTTMMDNQGYDIAFQNVGFSYNIGDAVLKDVTFTAKQGEVTELIGPSFWMKQRRLWM